jgi:2-phosphoglycerate kinase
VSESSTRTWDVLLLGGAAGTGKTSVSYPLARHFGVGITEVDDFQVLLETLTTPEQFPALHYWQTHPEAAEEPAERILERTLEVARVLAPGVRAVIDNHLDEQTPVVLEGDFLLPELHGANSDRVRAVFLYEPEERQIVENFLQREPEAGPQTKRARVSWLYGQWLKDEAGARGLSALPARPWETLFGRVLAAL